MPAGRSDQAPTADGGGVGEVFAFRPTDIHRVRHDGTIPAVTIHAYSRAVRRMGAYVADAEERLLRHALDGKVELRLGAV